ncbi:hypothetical protein HQN90_36940 [Paenibacillus alba]|uniref:hypothetical protein n=1 Tax=Paenibacillus alba TaxID=1197127 RepID=UPI0015675369|nr:hypothetical protein [Paenibacillus alba]NQX71678.1 hypothetical protein [Paenibacillus alba]
MKLMPEYAKNLIVGVAFHNNWSWYITEREYWFLNIEMEDRFGIEVLDESTADSFLYNIESFKIPTTELTEILSELMDTFQNYDEVLEFLPTIHVNFDNRELYSLFPELISFENYVPNHWKGEYKDFYELVPFAERYWIVDNENLFEKLYKNLKK